MMDLIGGGIFEVFTVTEENAFYHLTDCCERLARPGETIMRTKYHERLNLCVHVSCMRETVAKIPELYDSEIDVDMEIAKIRVAGLT